MYDGKHVHGSYASRSGVMQYARISVMFRHCVLQVIVRHWAVVRAIFVNGEDVFGKPSETALRRGAASLLANLCCG
jgi:hypothetical protein